MAERIFLRRTASRALFFGFTIMPLLAMHGQARQETVEVPPECALIQQKLESVMADRDNILAQIRLAYDQRNKAIEERKEALEKLDSALAEKEALIQRLEAFKDTAPPRPAVSRREEAIETAPPRESRVSEGDLFLQMQRELRLKKDLEVAERVAQDLIKELRETKKDRWGLEERIKTLEAENARLDRELSDWRLRAEQALKENAELSVRTSKAEQEIRRAPESLMELTRERDQLRRENADMHYNLGVLLAQSREYKRAAMEFQRAIELRPDDAAAHFNLGKVYADHLEEKEKAAGHFQQYLRLKPQAPDRNWVQSFIATVQAWRAEEKLV